MEAEHFKLDSLPVLVVSVLEPAPQSDSGTMTTLTNMSKLCELTNEQGRCTQDAAMDPSHFDLVRCICISWQLRIASDEQHARLPHISTNLA